jgi:hypothetical protein
MVDGIEILVVTTGCAGILLWSEAACVQIPNSSRRGTTTAVVCIGCCAYAFARDFFAVHGKTLSVYGHVLTAGHSGGVVLYSLLLLLYIPSNSLTTAARAYRR